MEFDRRYKQLNERQKEAVDHIDGPLMVIAGPGTGKTELLSIRAANILKKTDTLPENILCLTFTDSGAAAMRERLVGIIGKDAYKVSINTFHSFGTEIINRFREHFYNNATFSPADDIAQYEILTKIFEGLPYKNPLAIKMNGEFTYLKEAKTVISELKRNGGMTSDELLAIIQQDEICLDAFDKTLLPIISRRSHKNLFQPLSEILPELQEFAHSVQPLYNIQPLAKVLVTSLEHHLNEAIENDSTKPLTVWKKDWLGKNDQKEDVFKDRARLEKLKALSFIYYEYLRQMEENGLFDYDDMILQVIHAVETHDDLKATLQEQYLYIMVDEFQDTNNAQMRILSNLTDNPANEGSPNIMTVGDDDQAIYSFQGAEVNNMLRFREKFTDTKTIVLTDNYRSGVNILKSSREIILQGQERLESQIPEIIKELNANKPDDGKVRLIEQISAEAERHWIAEDISRVIEQNKTSDKKPTIAILARKHQDLVQILPFLQAKNLNISYEKQDNALEQEPIKQLELLARTIVHLNRSQHDRANALLPQLLSHVAWGIEPKQIWKLSLDAYSSKKDWMTTMSTTPMFADVHTFLVNCMASATQQTLEKTLDLLIGKIDGTPSPLYSHFFSPEKITQNPGKYLDYLSALKSIRAKLRDYRNSEDLSLEDFVEFIDTYRSLNLAIKTVRTSQKSEDADVELLSAHKSKGLEYDHVYVIQSVDSVWGQSAKLKSRSLSYPQNLSLAPAGDSVDERLRLFYVAMTRAKSNLTMTYSTSNDNSKATLVADFMAGSSVEAEKIEEPNIEKQIEISEISWQDRYTHQPKDVLSVLGPYLEKYKLSATAFTSFLDVTKGGPRAFLLNNLLRFPEAQSNALIYGNAIHYALQQAHLHMSSRGEMKPLEDILHDFESELQKQRLSEEDFEQLLQRGSDALPIFIKQTSMNKNQKAELSFSFQEVTVGDARLTGKIDVAEFNDENKTVFLTDYKTGKAPSSEKGTGDYEKKKLHHYGQQLVFYKLLIENSKDFSKYTSENGSIVFVEPTKSGVISSVEKSLTHEKTERQKILIQKVWERIMTLDLPDTSHYPNTVKGIEQFEQDLIDEKI